MSREGNSQKWRMKDNKSHFWRVTFTWVPIGSPMAPSTHQMQDSLAGTRRIAPSMVACAPRTSRPLSAKVPPRPGHHGRGFPQARPRRTQCLPWGSGTPGAPDIWVLGRAGETPGLKTRPWKGVYTTGGEISPRNF